VLIAGGGTMASVIREADSMHALGEEAAHALCIEVLGVTARLLAALLGDRASLVTWQDIHSQEIADRASSFIVLDVHTFAPACKFSDSSCSLPHIWDVTSDSIAAAVADSIAADELVLLKSCEPPADAETAGRASYQSLAAAGYVDRYFPQAVAGFAGRVQFVNLRGLGYDVRGLAADEPLH
jgi:aspartokinase-like uncharacterized kinase